MLETSIPVLRTGDYPRAHEFYTRIMGFECVEEGGDPARFGIFKRDRATVFVDGWNGVDAPYKHWRAYFHVADLDAAEADFRTKGANITREIENTVYGMREFEVTDPDGNVLCFGMDA